MKKVYFRKITEYDLGKDKCSRFEYVNKISLQEIDPRPAHVFQNLKKDTVIICSPLKRAYSSLPKGVKYSINKNLKEVLFDLSKFCTEEEFYKDGSIIVRRKFKEYFIADKLPEKRKFLFTGIETLLKQLSNCDEKKVFIISHSFKLKLIEAYIKTNGAIVNNPELIHKYIKDNKRTFKFEQGFDVYI